MTLLKDAIMTYMQRPNAELKQMSTEDLTLYLRSVIDDYKEGSMSAVVIQPENEYLIGEELENTHLLTAAAIVLELRERGGIETTPAELLVMCRDIQNSTEDTGVTIEKIVGELERKRN